MSTLELPLVTIENFEGPFDLLLELARQHKVNLAKVSLRAITDDFLRYISEQALPVSLQGDFLVVAATLMLIKIRQLLPQLTPAEEQEITALTDRVRIYQLYRQKALYLAQKWGVTQLYPAHFWAGISRNALGTLQFIPPNITAQNLGQLFQAVTQALPKPPQPRAHLTVRGRTLQEWLRLFSQRMEQVKQLIFQEAMRGASKQDTAVSFLALLEMARKQEVTLSQDSTFSHLIITRSV